MIPMSRRRWWRYLIGSLVLAAIAIGRPLARGWREYARTHPVWPIDVATGQEGQYADASWRLIAREVESSANGAVERYGPGMAFVRTRFTVIPGTNTDLQLLGRCRLRMRDRAGRRWDVSGRRSSTLPDNCGFGRDANFKTMTAKVGEPWTFEVGFVVPEDVVQEVVPEVIVPQQLPRYLRFTSKASPQLRRSDQSAPLR